MTYTHVRKIFPTSAEDAYAHTHTERHRYTHIVNHIRILGRLLNLGLRPGKILRDSPGLHLADPTPLQKVSCGFRGPSTLRKPLASDSAIPAKTCCAWDELAFPVFPFTGAHTDAHLRMGAPPHRDGSLALSCGTIDKHPKRMCNDVEHDNAAADFRVPANTP